MALVFGIIAVVLWEQLSGAIGIVVGAWMIYGALVRMNTAIKLHAANVKQVVIIKIVFTMHRKVINNVINPLYNQENPYHVENHLQDSLWIQD